MLSSGSGLGGKVVFVHGSLCDARVFDAVAVHRPADVEMITIDLPDHVRDEPGHDLGSMIHALAEALASIPAPYVLVGHSMGAHLVARVLPALNGRVSRALLLSGFAGLPSAVLDGYRVLSDGIASGKVDPRSALAPAVEAALGPDVVEPWRSHLRSIVGSWPADRVERAARRVLEVGVAPAMARFDTPAVIVHALDDVSIPSACARELIALGPRAELRELDRGGHFLPLSVPELVSSLAFSPE